MHQDPLAVLAIGVIAPAIVAPQAIIDYTSGVLGAAGLLLPVGCGSSLKICE